MAHPELRINVARLLAGERDPEDLHRLFGYLRFKTKGRAPGVKDIGDFQAHWDARHEGLTYDRAVRFYDMWRVGPFATQFRKSFGLPLPDLDDHSMALRAALQLVRDTIKVHSGFGYEIAKGLLEDVLRKAVVDPATGKLSFKAPLNDREARLWDALVTCPKHDEQLTQEELFSQFSECLIAEGLLTPDELPAFEELSDWIAIYAISRMHLVDIVRSNGEKIGTLEARTSATTDRLGVYFNAIRNTAQLTDTRELFKTNCLPEDWCVPELLDIELGPVVSMANWTFPIRLNSEGKLVPIGEISEAIRQRRAYVRQNFGNAS